MKILIGSSTYPLLNGVTTSINTTIDGFLAAGDQVVVIGPEYSQGIVRPEHRMVGSSLATRLLLQPFNKKERLFSRHSKKEIEKIASEFQPNAYWLHSLTTVRNAFELAMEDASKPMVLTYHTLVEDYGRIYGGQAGAWLMRRRSRDVANLMDTVIVPSQVIAKRLISYGVSRPIQVIPTGITIPKVGYSRAEIAQRFHFNPRDVVLLYVGRVAAEKNIQALLETTQELNRLEKKYTLLLLGPGDLVQTNKTARELGMSDKVICTGPLAKEDAQKIYYAADLFVIASQTETQGLVIGEAMLANLPVVALNSPIQPEIYPDSVAVVVKTESDFPTAIKNLLTDRTKQEKLRMAGKKFVQEKFSVSQMITRQRAIFEKLVK